MAQMFTALPVQLTNRIFCYYTNASQQLQIARITNVPGWQFERLIFPGQRLIFEATPEALLTIEADNSTTPLCQIACQHLQVREPMITSGQAAPVELREVPLTESWSEVNVSGSSTQPDAKPI
jgi:hypothetical protein